MDITKRQVSGELTLALSGRFDFNAQSDFRRNFEDVLNTHEIKTIVLEMANVNYLDSSALAGLLQLSERAREIGTKVSIAHCSEQVSKIFSMAKFYKYMKIL